MYLIKRFIANMIDSFLVLGVIIILSLGSNNVNIDNIKIFDVFIFLLKTIITGFYYVYMESQYQGTFGKKCMKLKILQINNTNLSYKISLIRYLLLNFCILLSMILFLNFIKIPFVAFIMLFASLSFLFNNHKESQFLWDKVMKTQVISEYQIIDTQEEKFNENHTMEF